MSETNRPVDWKVPTDLADKIAEEIAEWANKYCVSWEATGTMHLDCPTLATIARLTED